MEWLNKVLDNNETIYVAVAAAGGIARYLHSYLNEAKVFAWRHFIAHTFVSSFSGYMFYSFAAHVAGFPESVISVFAGLGGWMGVEAMKTLETMIKRKIKEDTDKDVK